MLMEQAASLNNCAMGDRLVNEKRIAAEDELFQEFLAFIPALRELEVSLRAVVSGVTLKRDDIVTLRHGDNEATVLAELFALHEGGMIVVGKRCIEVSRTRTASVCRIEAEYTFANAVCIVSRCQYAPHDGGNVMILRLTDPSLQA